MSVLKLQQLRIAAELGEKLAVLRTLRDATRPSSHNSVAFLQIHQKVFKRAAGDDDEPGPKIGSAQVALSDANAMLGAMVAALEKQLQDMGVET